MIWIWIVGAGLVLYVLGSSWKVIPNDPPHIAVVTIFGKRTKQVKGEGLRLFPLHPWVYDGIQINMSTRTFVVTQNVQAKHTGDVRVVVHITWEPLASHAIEYLNKGRDKGVEEVLQGAVSDAIRKWVQAGSNVAQDWRSSLETDTNSYIMMLDMVRDLPGGNITEIIDEQTKNQRNRTSITIPSLGILIERFHIAQVTTSGQVVTSASQAEAAHFSRDMKKLDMRQFTALIDEMMKALNISASEASVLMASNEGKLSDFKRSIIEIKPDIETGKLETLVGLAKNLFGSSS